MHLKVDKGVALPEAKGRFSQVFSTMLVGDSVFLAGFAPVEAHSATRNMRVKHGFRFVQRKTVNEDGTPGIRVWRVE